MDVEIHEYRPHAPAVRSGIVAVCAALVVHGMLVAGMLRQETHRLAGIGFGPLTSAGEIEVTELPSPLMVPLPPEKKPQEIELGAASGKGTSFERTTGEQPQQARKGDEDQPYLRLRTGAMVSGLAGTAAAKSGVAGQQSAAQKQQAAAAADGVKTAAARSVVVSASAGTAAPAAKAQQSKQPDAAGARVEGTAKPRDAEALTGAAKDATVSPAAAPAAGAKKETVAQSGSKEKLTGENTSARDGGAPDAKAKPDADSVREVEPPPLATAESTGPRVSKTPTTQPNNAAGQTASEANAAAAKASAGATASASANPGGGWFAGDPGPHGSTDSDPFTTQGGSVVFRAGSMEQRLGFGCKITKPKILLKGEVDEYFMVRPTVVLKLKCDATGKVVDATVTQGSGSPDIDEPTRIETYNWWFEPPKDAAGNPTPRTFSFTVKYYD